jgi:uncharacterized protein (TIGR03086 family)
MLDLLERTYRHTEKILADIPADRWSSPSPCDGWTVHDVAGHLVWAMDSFVRIVTGEPMAEAYELSADPAADYRAVADRCLSAFADPDVLRREHPFPSGPTPGSVIATISLSESLVHGWDLAKGAGLPYAPDPDAVALLRAWQDEAPPAEGLFGPPVPVSVDAPPFTVLLANTGRTA